MHHWFHWPWQKWTGGTSRWSAQATKGPGREGFGPLDGWEGNMLKKGKSCYYIYLHYRYINVEIEMCVDMCVCMRCVWCYRSLYDIAIIKHLYVYFPIAWWSDPFQRSFVRPDSPATPSEALQTLGSSWYGRHLDPLTRVWFEEIFGDVG